MRKKENKDKKEKVSLFFPANYDIGLSLKEKVGLRLFSKREDSNDEIICQYFFSDMIKVQSIFLPYSSDIQIITEEFPLSEKGCQECTQAFKHPISMEIVQTILETNCLVTGLVVYSKPLLKLVK